MSVYLFALARRITQSKLHVRKFTLETTSKMAWERLEQVEAINQTE